MIIMLAKDSFVRFAITFNPSRVAIGVFYQNILREDLQSF